MRRFAQETRAKKMTPGIRFLLISVVAIAPPLYAAPPAIRDEILDAHNQVRAKAGIPALKWSERLAAVAQEWANHLIASGAFSHRPNSAYGENLFTIEGARATPEQVVAAWAAESAGYDYKTNRCRGVCGHYTQLVWRDTKDVGCAVARQGRREVWVCNYDPPGNWVGRRPY